MKAPIDKGPSVSPLKVTNPARIPAARYYDEQFFRLERERLWPHVWQMAARLDQIPEVGDWTTYSNLDSSIIVVNTQAGIKVYHNACRHRGVRLAKGHGNCAVQGFVCPFHGWRWNMDGENTFVYGKHLFSEAQVGGEELDLPEVRAEIWGGCIFINFDEGAPSFRETIGPLCERLEAHGASDLRAEWWYQTVLPANWKVAMEAFMEGYHTMRTHPQLQQTVPHLYNSMYGQETGGIGVPTNPNLSVRENILTQIKHLELVSEGMAGMVHEKEIAILKQLADVELPEDPNEAVMTWFGIANAEITRQLQARGEPVPDLNAVAASHPVKAVEFIFPHFFLLPMFSSMSAYRVRPLTAESCIFEIWSLTMAAPDEAWESPKEPIVLPYNSEDFPSIPRQDYTNIPEQQIGLRSSGFEFMRLSENIEGLIGNYHRVIDGYLEGKAPEMLAGAVQELASNYDGPVKELWPLTG